MSKLRRLKDLLKKAFTVSRKKEAEDITAPNPFWGTNTVLWGELTAEEKIRAFTPLKIKHHLD